MRVLSNLPENQSCRAVSWNRLGMPTRQKIYPIEPEHNGFVSHLVSISRRPSLSQHFVLPQIPSLEWLTHLIYLISPTKCKNQGTRAEQRGGTHLTRVRITKHDKLPNPGTSMPTLPKRNLSRTTRPCRVAELITVFFCKSPLPHAMSGWLWSWVQYILCG